MNIDIYPNPSNGKFTINSNNIRQIEIIDAIGRTIHSYNITSIKSINLNNFSKGIYVVKIETPLNIIIKKIKF